MVLLRYAVSRKLILTTESYCHWIVVGDTRYSRKLESRVEAEWEGGKLSVVSAAGLIALKQLRGSPQDLADIEALTGEGSNEAR